MLTRATLIARVTRNPLMPGLVTWLLLMIGYWAAGSSGSSDGAMLLAIGGMFAVLFFLGRYAPVRLPQVPERDGILLLAIGLGAFVLEAGYFGLPILGQVNYTEFGFPVVHHVVFTLWTAPLLARRRPFVHLLVALGVGAMIFNRQMMLLSMIAYLMRVGSRGFFAPIVVGVAVVALGSLRNQLLGVEEVVRQDGQFLSGPLGGLLFWGFLYSAGPYSATFGAATGVEGPINLADYWNTVPEWAVLAKIGFPLGLSLAVFYPLLAVLVAVLTRARSYEAQIFGILIHVLSYMTFFSATLLSTPLIGCFLVIVAIRRMQQTRM